MACTGASTRSGRPSEARVVVRPDHGDPSPPNPFRMPVRFPAMPCVWVLPEVSVTLTVSGMLNMSTVVELMKMPVPPLLARANSVQS